MEKKELFKYLIKEFHERELPKVEPRDLILPKTNKITTLVGSRRAGKTFYFYQIIQGLLKNISKERILYLNFEDDRVLPIDVKELNSILEAYYELYPNNKDKEIFVFFDEIQNIDGWERYIRRIYDQEKVKVFVTGSNSKLLSREIATSLRGRTLTFPIFPLSFKEFLAFNNIKIDKHTEYSKQRFKVKKLLERYLLYGGFPEVVLEENKLEQNILRSYFEIMLYRDIVERFSVRNTTLLKMLSKYLLTNISAPFSVNAYYKSLKQQLPVSKETIHEYLSHLEEANVVFLVPFFSYKIKQQQANPKKAYCIDMGLRNAVSFKFSEDQGALVENLVFLELQRRGKDTYYWNGKGEVDFVVKNKDHSLTAIDVTYTNKIGEEEIKALLEFKKEFKNRKVKKLILLTKDTEKREKGIELIPLWKWLLSI